MYKIVIISALIIIFSGRLFSQFIPSYNIINGDIQSSSGYYFVNTMKPGGGLQNQFNLLVLDRFGNLVFVKNFNNTALDFKLHANGKMSYSYTFSGNANLKYFILDSSFTIRDSVRTVGYNTDSHDMQMLSNGHYLLMGIENRIMNLSSYNWFNGNGSPGSSNATVLCGVIQELDVNKNVVFTWKSADNFLFSDVQEQWLFNPNLIDWTHFNSVAKDNDGNILVSSRNFSEVTKINRQTGAVIWRMGGKRNQLTFINDPHNGFLGHHDARRISNGNLTLFDNGYLNASVHNARGVEYNVNEQNLTASLVWSYNYSNSSSRFLGSMQRNPSGNNIIGWGGLINQNIMFSAHKPDGGLILGINFPDTVLTYRAFNYTTLPWSFNRPLISCSSSGGNYYLEAPQGHASYKWSTGANTRVIQITQPGIYYVFVPYGTGGFISSERVVITSMIDVCGQISGVVQTSNVIPNQFSLSQNYPNPFNPSTKIKFAVPLSPFEGGRGIIRLVIYDVLGHEVETLVNEQLTAGFYEADWSADKFSSGVYYYKLTAGDFTETKKMVLMK